MKLLAHNNWPDFFDRLSVRFACSVHPRRLVFLFQDGPRYLLRYCSPNFRDWNAEYVSRETAVARYEMLPAHAVPSEVFRF